MDNNTREQKRELTEAEEIKAMSLALAYRDKLPNELSHNHLRSAGYEDGYKDALSSLPDKDGVIAELIATLTETKKELFTAKVFHMVTEGLPLDLAEKAVASSQAILLIESIIKRLKPTPCNQ